MKFFLAGHEGLYNRGCEALARAIVQILTERFGPCEFLLPSKDLAADRRQWPDADKQGVSFVEFPPFPGSIRAWNALHRISPPLAWALGPPQPDMLHPFEAALTGCDAVVMTGGDILSLDYGPASVVRWIAQGESALARKLPLVLWSSSVGPFTADRNVEAYAVQHLKKYDVLSTRESHSQRYLQSLSVTNSTQCVDPAFVMRPQSAGVDIAPLTGARGVLGFNVSPLVAKVRQADGTLEQFENDIMQFWREVIDQHGMSVLLIPHVDPPAGEDWDGDTNYMRDLLRRFGGASESIAMAPVQLNAAQLKHVVSTCRFFIGARTHATIAGLSMGVPTLSLGYSVKARGINEDLFGHLNYMRETRNLGFDTLFSGFKTLLAEEHSIRSTLAERIPEWKRRAALPADMIAQRLMQPAGVVLDR